MSYYVIFRQQPIGCLEVKIFPFVCNFLVLLSQAFDSFEPTVTSLVAMQKRKIILSINAKYNSKFKTYFRY